jgi:hypothetical protein
MVEHVGIGAGNDEKFESGPGCDGGSARVLAAGQVAGGDGPAAPAAGGCVSLRGLGSPNRWTLETAFQHIEKHFESEIDTLAYPRAALFGFRLALVAYNIFQVALTALDSAHQEPVSQTVSTLLGHEIAATFLALLMLSESWDWHFLAKLSPVEFALWLRDVPSGVNPKKIPEAWARPQTAPTEFALRPKTSACIDAPPTSRASQQDGCSTCGYTLKELVSEPCGLSTKTVDKCVDTVSVLRPK